jgi:hypothetical protein
MRDSAVMILHHAVGEIVLLGIAAHVLERQHRDRRFFGQGKSGRRLPARCAFGLGRGLRQGLRSNLQRIETDWFGDILELGSSEIADRHLEPPLDLPIGVLGQTDGTGLGDAFQSRGDIDAVAHQVAVALLDDIAKMDADTEFNAALRRQASVALNHAVLHLDGAAHGVNDAAELDQDAVAGALHHTAVMHGDGRIDQIAAQPSEPRQRAILVGPN